MGVSLAGVAAS